MSHFVLLPGDGIGPEVVAEARKVLEAVAVRFGLAFTFEEQLIGGAAIEATGDPLPSSTVAACRVSDAVILGAVGGPMWDDPMAKTRPEDGLLGIRAELGLYANLRPIQVHFPTASPLRDAAGVDILFVRELTGGIYFGPSMLSADGQVASNEMVYSATEIERVVRMAGEAATSRRGKVTSVDKANVLESSRLWREVASEVARDFADIKLEHQLVDSAAMRLVSQPSAFDVVVTENMFGDILTDEAAVISGSLGLLPSASLGQGRLGLYEPIHGSAPDIAGKGIANPLGTVLSAAMLLRHSLGLQQEARTIEQAVEAAIRGGARTIDLGGSLTTAQMTGAVLQRIGK